VGTFISACSMFNKSVVEGCDQIIIVYPPQKQNSPPDTKIELLCFLTWDVKDYVIPPTIVGGIDSLLTIFYYPEVARRAEISGPVICEFTITTEGKATNIKIIKSIGAGCDEVVSNAIKSLSYIPAERNGLNINQLMRVSVNFILIRKKP
jgi:TonB family protein